MGVSAGVKAAAGAAVKAAATPVKDVLVQEVKAAVAQIAPNLPAMQRAMLTTAAAAVGGMKEDMAIALAREVIKLGAELRAVMAAHGVPNNGEAES